MKIAVAGIGYVGLSNAILLAQNHDVTAVDIREEKTILVNRRISPIADPDMEEFFATHELSLTATTDGETAYRDARFVIVATPTDYDPEKNSFNTESVEAVIKEVERVNPDAAIIIKSTIPLGYTKDTVEKHPGLKILFFPEFLREGCALHGNLYPTRIVAGIPDKRKELFEAANEFLTILQEGAIKKDIPTLFVDSMEAEAIKLFANTYLAMRVSFFNELDTYASLKGLNARNIIEGVCLDPRIGTHYNNPSFGYGGYCLPKDTKQLLANYHDVPEDLIAAVVASNKTRKKFVADQIIEQVKSRSKETNGVIGVYRLAMKSGSDNFRQSSVLDVIQYLRKSDCKVVIYEPKLEDDMFLGISVINDLTLFKKKCDLIIANRFTEDLEDCKDRVYTRDIYKRD